MTQQSMITLPASPQESLQALERAVAQQFKWRILTQGGTDTPRFVIEKQVRYDLVRGLPMHALYQITGSLHKAKRGETTLSYVVSGQSIIPALTAALHISVFLVAIVLLAMVLFNPNTVNQGVGVLLIGVMILALIGYGIFAYRSYQNHLSDLNRFIEEFAQRMGAQSAT